MIFIELDANIVDYSASYIQRFKKMIGLIQRTHSASVAIDKLKIAEIGPGMLVLVGFRRGDGEHLLERFVERLLNYRLFPDENGRMNHSLRDINGELLLVPQFTLAANTNAGNRPSFTPAAPPEAGRKLFAELQQKMRIAWPNAAYGVFGADMQVSLVNDGPVTFWVEVPNDQYNRKNGLEPPN